jgi:hypothetical protein
VRKYANISSVMSGAAGSAVDEEESEDRGVDNQERQLEHLEHEAPSGSEQVV